MSRAEAPDERTIASDYELFSPTQILAFLGAHVPLALLFRAVGAPLSTAHALLVLAFGVTSAVRGRVDRVVMVVGYIAGAEVFWRMTNARILWETGKYGAAAIMLIALLRNNLVRPPALPLAYFGLLLPSCVLTLSQESWPAASNQLSFNLSGPLALMVSAWFFSTMELTPRHMRGLFIAIAAPIICVLTLAVYGTVTTAGITFLDQSNSATSGGYGPNQVSAVLGMGALLSLFLATDGTTKGTMRAALVGLLVAFAAQSALTFSRGGLAAAGGSAALAAFFSAKDTRVRGKLLPLAAAILAIGYLLIPYLDAYTGGEMSVRFQDSNLTGRDYMARVELDLFKENPLFGVGPGGARVERMGGFLVQGGPRSASSRVGLEYAAHTEYARLLSEHGIFGLTALGLLVISAFSNIRQVRDPIVRGLVAGMVAWGALFMLSSAMRIYMPSLVFGLAFATFVADASPALQVARSGLRRLTEGHPAQKDPGPIPTK